MKRLMTILTVLVIITMLVVVGTALANGCTDETTAKRVLEAQGYTQIEFTGYRPFMSGEGDVYSTGFRAKGVNGQTVTGAVTNGPFKGSTIRFD